MKIPVKIVSEVDIPSMITSDHKHFSDFIEYVKTCQFLAGSHHNDIETYLGYSQGGKNAQKIHYFEILMETNNKLTLRLGWDRKFLLRDSSIIILEKP